MLDSHSATIVPTIRIQPQCISTKSNMLCAVPALLCTLLCTSAAAAMRNCKILGEEWGLPLKSPKPGRKARAYGTHDRPYKCDMRQRTIMCKRGGRDRWHTLLKGLRYGTKGRHQQKKTVFFSLGKTPKF